jgi:hypothetical protein
LVIEDVVMKTVKLTTLFAGLITASFAMASPVYLECYTEYGNDRTSFSVKADESAGTITHSDQLGAYNAVGFFGANEIRYKFDQPIAGTIVAEYTYEINRTTLEIVGQSVVINRHRTGQTTGDTIGPLVGKCDVAEMKDRKI